MNPEYAEASHPFHSATLERTGITNSTTKADAEVVSAVEELRTDVAEWADQIQVQVASWMEELRAEAVTWVEQLRAEAVGQAGEFAAQLATEAYTVATLRTSLDGAVESAAATQAQTDQNAGLLRKELASLRGLVAELRVQRAADAEAVLAAQAAALQVAAETKQAGQNLEAEIGRLSSEVEELRGRLEPQDTGPSRKRSRQKKKAKH